MIPSETQERLRENFRRVTESVDEACRSAGRDRSDVRVVAVSKYVDASVTAELVRVGATDLGESRPQSLWSKAESSDFVECNQSTHAGPRWHMIGHLQSNKVRRLLRHRVTIHSIDSPRILHAVADEASRIETSVDVLLEINVAADPKKTGLSVDDAERLLDDSMPAGVRCIGWMTMASRNVAASPRQQFASLRELSERYADREDIGKELSMGMSGDFVDAIREGATMVRIGSKLFDGLM